MTNPDNAIGTNGAYGGRTSVNAFNDNLAIYTAAGIISGWQCNPSSGMAVEIGGVSGIRDVAVAEDPSGNRTTINNTSGSPVEVAIPAAPSTNSRVDYIVAYVANPPEGDSTELDNPSAAGLITVSGTTSSSPAGPSDSAIRSAITADGGTGSTAYYVVLANITVDSGTTDITSDNITTGAYAGIGSNNIDWETMPFSDVEFGRNSGAKTISFSKTHSSAPTAVIATMTGAANTDVILSISVWNISATGFTTYPRYSRAPSEVGVATESYNWVAFWT